MSSAGTEARRALKDDACLLIASCDTYSDVWGIAHRQLRRMWPDCALRQYLLTNEQRPALEGLEPLVTGPDLGWSANLRRALAMIPEPYVFLYIDDLFLVEKVDNALVEEKLRWAIDNDVNYLRLHPYPKLDERRKAIIPVPRDSAYRTATVMSFWNKECLADLLDPSENAWQFEINGTERSMELDRFFATRERCFSFSNLIIKGQLRRGAVSLLAEHGHDACVRRRVLSRSAELAQILRDLRARLFWQLPQKYQKPVRAFFMDASRFARR